MPSILIDEDEKGGSRTGFVTDKETVTGNSFFSKEICTAPKYPELYPRKVVVEQLNSFTPSGTKYGKMKNNVASTSKSLLR